MTLNHPARYWSRSEDGRIQCELCPCHCRLREGQRGACFVRQHLEGQMVLTTYGRSSGFCIDPIEKKPLNHFLPGTPVMSFGTAGCNLSCAFCQNWDISKSRDMDRLMDKASPAKLVEAAKTHGCRSIAFTYNDPVIFLEYAVDTARLAREAGLHPVAVTAGFIEPAATPEFFGAMDAVNIDLKAFSPDFYRQVCNAEIEPVLEAILYAVKETNAWVELTTLLIPGKNDNDQELHALAQWVREELGPSVPLHFSAFHPDFRMLDTPATPLATLQRARQIAMQHGLRYVYTGNVHDPEGDCTLCPGCGNAVIERDWYQLLAWRIKDNCCTHCGERIDGVFENTPGTWGAKRQPVRLG